MLIGPIAFFFFAYIFGKTSVLVQRSLAVQTKHHERMSFIRSAMSSLGLPSELRMRIESYHHYMHVNHNPIAYESLFSGLSEYLLIELKLFLFRQLFVSSDLFKDSDPNLIQRLVLTLTECTFCPGDVIILKGAVGAEMFFIVGVWCLGFVLVCQIKICVLDYGFVVLSVKFKISNVFVGVVHGFQIRVEKQIIQWRSQ